MPRVPFDPEDLETYGAWLSPDGYYTLASGGHAESARRIAKSKGWKVPPMSTIHDIMFDNGYYRVVFEDNNVLFEHGVIQALDPRLIAEAMSNVPGMPIFTSPTWNPLSESGQTSGNKYKNLADFKTKTGTGATDKDLLRSAVDPDLGFGKGQEEEEPAFSAYARTTRWLKENTMLWYNPKANKQAGLFEEEMLSRNPRSQALADKLRAAGLTEIGSRHGKAGVQYGIEGKARRVSIGARDVMLNYFLVQGRDARWNMYKSFSLKKVIEHPNIDPVLKEWVDWVGRGPTMIEVREKQRERAMSDQYAAATGLEKALNQTPQPTEAPPPVQPAPPPQPEQPGTERQASKGEPTNLNLWVLKDLFKDKDEVPNRLDPTRVTHLRRCMSAGLIEAVGGRGGTLRLTEKGKQAIRPAQSMPTEQAAPTEPRRCECGASIPHLARECPDCGKSVD